MKARMICCVCGKFLHWTDTFNGMDSHGYYEKHYEEAMRAADDAFRRGEALCQKEPAGEEEP